MFEVFGPFNIVCYGEQSLYVYMDEDKLMAATCVVHSKALIGRV